MSQFSLFGPASPFGDSDHWRAPLTTERPPSTRTQSVSPPTSSCTPDALLSSSSSSSTSPGSSSSSSPEAKRPLRGLRTCEPPPGARAGSRSTVRQMSFADWEPAHVQRQISERTNTADISSQFLSLSISNTDDLKCDSSMESRHWFEQNVNWLAEQLKYQPAACLGSPKFDNRQNRPANKEPAIVHRSTYIPSTRLHDFDERTMRLHPVTRDSRRSSTATHRKRNFSTRAPETLCVFCRKNGEMSEVYTTHRLKDCWGRVICPILRAFTCPICGESGDNAHTERYCPYVQ